MASYKKILFLCMSLILLLMMTAACSGGEGTTTVGTTTTAQTTQTQASTTMASSTVMSAKTTTTMETPATTKPGVTIESGSGNSGASLPAGYPADLFPLYKDSYITGAIANAGSFTIMAESKDDWQKVAAFYKDVLKKAEVTSSMDTATSFTSFGKIGSYTYNFDVSATDQPQTEGYQTSIVIMLMP